jgi:hypothetical protein
LEKENHEIRMFVSYRNDATTFLPKINPLAMLKSQVTNTLLLTIKNFLEENPAHLFDESQTFLFHGFLFPKIEYFIKKSFFKDSFLNPHFNLFHSPFWRVMHPYRRVIHPKG